MADRSRSRSPQRDDDNAHGHDDSRANDAPHDNGGNGGGNGGGGDEEVKLYVGNLNYGRLLWLLIFETLLFKILKLNKVCHSLSLLLSSL